MRLYHNLAKILSSAALFAAFVCAGRLQAATISYSNPIPASDASGHSSLPATASFTLSEFDPSLGTLTGVEVDFALTYKGEVDVLNFTSSSNPFTNASSQLPIAMTTPSSVSPFDLPLVTASYSVASGNANPPMFSQTFFPDPGSPSSNTIVFNPVSFAPYEGIGNNSYQLGYGTGNYGGTGVGVAFGGDANSSGTATVIYTYSPVPEPATFVLLVVGAAGLAATARRRIGKRTA